MKKNIITIAIIAIIFCSCNQKSTSTNSNLLQYDNTEVQYKPDTAYFDNKVDFSFFQKLAEAVSNGKVAAYDFPLFTFDFTEKLDILKPELLKSNLAANNMVVSSEDTATGKITDKIFIRDFNKDAKSIYFIEEWMLDNNLKFTKNLKYYAPVRFFFTPGSTDKKIPSLAFVIQNKDISEKNEKDLISIAKHIFYTVSLESNENTGPLLFGMNKQRLLSMLVDSVFNRKTKVFDVDLTKFDIGAELTAENARKNMGERIDSVFTQSETGNSFAGIDTMKATDNKRQIKELFFIEDWLYYAETFSIRKKIIAFGPIREFENASTLQIQRSIPYAIVMP